MKVNKLMSSVLCISMLYGNILPTFATQELNNDTLDQKQDTEVLYNKSATYFVSIPKTIVLGESKTSNYSVKVSGDISSDQKVTVLPIDEISQTDGYNFYMKDQNSINPKVDVIGTATQSKEEWNFQDVANSIETIDNSISAKDLTSGSWKGTFNFAINLKQVGISVSATDTNNNNLNASATNIEGETKEQLLSSLVETGYINDVNEVDGLVNVESDDFDNIAHTTFDVSNLYEEGDTVAILHYNEETQEWEYICTDIVTDGKVSGDFTSYSPVAFVKVNEDGIYENIFRSYEDMWTCDEKYIFEGTGTFVTIGGRTYNKTNEGKAVVAIIKDTSNTTIAVIASTNIDYIDCWCSYNSSTRYSYVSFDYLGLTWYFTHVPYGWRENYTGNGFAQTIRLNMNVWNAVGNEETKKSVGLEFLKAIDVQLVGYNENKTLEP